MCGRTTTQTQEWLCLFLLLEKRCGGLWILVGIVYLGNNVYLVARTIHVVTSWFVTLSNNVTIYCFSSSQRRGHLRETHEVGRAEVPS